MTSHDVVDVVRGLVGRRTKVGHGGTLDPAACGVLVVCVGAATRLAEYLLQARKCYRGEITLGVSTDTEDAEGRVVATASAAGLAEQAVREAVAALVGERHMRPPMHSAVRVGGRRLYSLARGGQEAERTPRRVVIYEAVLVAFCPGPQARVLFDVACSKGTYVRSLAVAVGEHLALPAHLSFLVRTAVGRHTLESAVTLDELAQEGAWQAALLPPAKALGHLPAVQLSSHVALRRFCAGSTTALAPDAAGGLCAVLGPEGGLVGVGLVVTSREWDTALLKPRKVLVEP